MPDPMRDKKGPTQPQRSKWGAMKWKESQDPISWSCADARCLQAAIAAVTEDGAAVLFSKTSDGGALALQIMAGPERYKYYLADSTEVDDLLREMGVYKNP